MGKYDDIINLPHHVSETHPQMPMSERAAQFSPFAALSGHGDAIIETARLTDAQKALNEDDAVALNRTLGKIQELDNPEVSITFFQPDGRKEGGVYVTVIGAVKRIDPVSGIVALIDGAKVPIGTILRVELR